MTRSARVCAQGHNALLYRKWLRKSVGNVFETPLTELWTHPEVQRYREGLFHEGCSVGCFNHSLYELEQSTGRSFSPEEDPAAAH